MNSGFFENTQVAYRLKSDFELKRAYWLFRLMQSRSFVKLGKALTHLAIKLRLPVEGLIKATVFNQFCSGTSAQGSQSVVNRLGKLNIASVLAYSVEGTASEEGFEVSLEKTLATLEAQAGSPHHPYGVFKPTAIGALALFEKVSAEVALSSEETAAWKRVEQRFDKLCRSSVDLKMKLFVDAEESWIQPAIDRLTEAAMIRYNQKQLWIVTTVQMYRYDRIAYLEYLVTKAYQENFQVGVKLVRGAYIEKEIARANALGYHNPICKSKAATDLNFDAGVAYLVDNLDLCTLFMGSHNEKSIAGLMRILKDKKIPNDHPNIWFGQLYGMSDHLSFNLAKAGYNVAKYIPFGPVRKVLPYLIRRAEENTSVAGQSSRELEMIEKELKRRRFKVAGAA